MTLPTLNGDDDVVVYGLQQLFRHCHETANRTGNCYDNDIHACWECL